MVLYNNFEKVIKSCDIGELNGKVKAKDRLVIGDTAVGFKTRESMGEIYFFQLLSLLAHCKSKLQMYHLLLPFVNHDHKYYFFLPFTNHKYTYYLLLPFANHNYKCISALCKL